MDYKKITTLAAVFAALNLPADEKPDVSRWPARYHAHKQHEYDVQMAIDAINGPDWVVDWNNTDQLKYYLWVYTEPDASRVSGRGLSLLDVYDDDSYAIVGPRLCFESREKALHFWEHFKPLYENYYLG